MTDDNASTSNGSNLWPPVPQRLREMLQDYPEHVDRLQEALNTVIEKPSPLTPLFEAAVWALEGRLESFYREARREFEEAKTNGDTEFIAKADEKQRLMTKACWKHVWLTDEALWDYFQHYTQPYY